MSYYQGALAKNETEKKRILLHIILSWGIFSIMFWIAAYHKPFHMDEFYSWVYAERCTFSEIFSLKEFGIGHPPLFHLMQKFTQTVLSPYNPIQVRLANYVIGSAFVIVFVKVFSQYKTFPLFFYAVSSSASVLDTFVFSRMWGLVCLFSLLFVHTGEQYLRTRSAMTLSVFLGIGFLGILSDYSFILLFPYVLTVLWLHKPRVKVFLLSLVAVWLISTCFFLIVKGHDINHLLYSLGIAPTRIAHEIWLLLSKFWFYEPFLLALLVVLISFWSSLKKKGRHLSDTTGDHNPFVAMMVALFAILIVIDLGERYGILRVRHVVPIVLSVFFLVLIFMRAKMSNATEGEADMNRLTVGIAGGVFVLLSANSFFWRNLIEARFLTILLPFLLLLIYRKFSLVQLYIMSGILIISGLLYVSSNGVSDFFPPPAFKDDSSIVFQDVHAYANQYLRSNKSASPNPFMIDLLLFQRYCKVCRMGTDSIPYNNFDTFWIVGRRTFDPSKVVPENFVLTETRDAGLTWSDKLQLKYFTPIYPLRFFRILEYHRI